MIPQVSASSAELVPAGLSVLGYFGVCVGRRVCQGLYMPGERESPCVLWVSRSVFFHQTVPETPGLREKTE